MKNQKSNFTLGFVHSNHSRVRSSQRGINDEVIDLVTNHGLLIKKQGCKFYMGARKLFPETIDHKLVEKASNVLVLVKNNLIITCYKDSDVIKEVKRKSRRNLKRRVALPIHSS